MIEMRMRRAAVVALASGLAAGCGSTITRSSSFDEGDLLDPSQPRASQPVVHITAAGPDPVVLHVDAPVTVTFVNQDSVPHHMQEAPELQYSPCPELAGLKAIAPSQSTSVTITRAEILCAYHEASDPNNRTFQGLLAVH
jgi:plastocyanin